MAMQIVHYSDCGPVRPANQDAYCVFSADTAQGPVSMLAVCDGMGGLSSGEVASATVIRAFADWFRLELPLLLQAGPLRAEPVSAGWNSVLRGCHARLRQAAAARQIRWGTTLSLVLLTAGEYYLLHVGDSRAYLDDGAAALQLTPDQTLAMRELEAGRLSPADYVQDPRRNVLLQCIGDQSVSPFFRVGEKPRSGAVLLCSDGFYHTVRPEELHAALAGPGTRADLQQQIWALADRARSLGETDNITAVALRWDGAPAARRATLSLGQGAAPGGLECAAKVICINAEPV